MKTMGTYLLDFAVELMWLFTEMAPYLLLGFAIAGVLHAFIPQHHISKYLGKGNVKSVINASLLGIPLPLCSCGVIPTGISFHDNGASKGATVSFLISTPQTGVDSVLATYSLLGLPFALIRPVAALITGFFGGVMANSESNQKPISKTVNAVNQGNTSKWQQAFDYAFSTFLEDIVKWLLMGLIIAAIFAVIIPNNFFDQFIEYPLLNMLLIVAASIPLYVCATGSIPIAAVLMAKGLSPGVAFVFLMAGPATNAATITVIKQSLGTKALWAYLASIILGALAFGYIIDLLPSYWFILPDMADSIHQHNPEQLDGLSLISSIILGSLIIKAIWKKYGPASKPKAMKSNQTVYKVEGMTCNHCKANVEKNLATVGQIETVEVDLANKLVYVTGINKEGEVAQKIADLGYTYLGKK